MEFFKTIKQIDFIGKRHLFVGISVVVILAGAASLFLKRGPKLGIDFTGGALVQFRFDKEIEIDQVRQALTEKGFPGAELQSFANHNAVLVRIPAEQSTDADQLARDLLPSLLARSPGNSGIVERAEFVGPTVGAHLRRQAFWAVILSLLSIIVYVALRFRSLVWGVSGVIALAHDVFATLGVFSILNKEVNLIIIAALLTIAGYSINDTIVIFDRVRENLRLYRKEGLGEILNRSVNETLSRTIITSLTVFLATLALFFLGGEVLHDFSFAMLCGIMLGTYSTVFVASPIVYEWETRRAQRVRR